jgi:abhydrolase domain-containing protein 6
MIGSVLTSVVMQTLEVLRFCAGFSSKNATVDQFSWSYIERQGKDEDSTDPVVFLHGFSSVKESWVNVARGVDKRYKVVIPDLPGQGRTTPADALMNYSVDRQARRLHEFLQSEIPADKKVHLVGCSMGGMLAGVYAGMYPTRVRSLTLICPAGVTMPKKSEAFRILEETGKNLLLAHTAEDIITMNEFISYKPRTIPKPIANAFAQEREKQLPVFEKIVTDCLMDPSVLDGYLPQIRARTLVMWGKNDRVLDISSLDVLEQKLVNAPARHVIRIDECGHTVQHEKYAEVTAAINAHLVGDAPTFPAVDNKP